MYIEGEDQCNLKRTQGIRENSQSKDKKNRRGKRKEEREKVDWLSPYEVNY